MMTLALFWMSRHNTQCVQVAFDKVTRPQQHQWAEQLTFLQSNESTLEKDTQKHILITYK